jgi:hypothetical protein
MLLKIKTNYLHVTNTKHIGCYEEIDDIIEQKRGLEKQN